MKKILLTLLFVSSLLTLSVAHSGGTDSRGCHTDYKTGWYHCH